nr:hypothetical protein [Tanacetum cinerariifolium]
MMAIAAGGNAAGHAPAGAAAGGDAPAGAAAGGDAADEANVVANDAAGGAAEAPQVPKSPSVSPVRKPTPERHPTPERPLSLPPSSPETEWVVLDPVSPIADWRPWPYVHVHFPEPESLPFLPEQTFIYEEPVKFGPVPRPTGYVDPDDIEPIFFGPQPSPMDYVEPKFEAHLRRRKLVIADSDEEAEVAAEVAAAKEDDIDLDEITALATAALGRTPRPTYAFTRKLFANMKFRWAQDPPESPSFPPEQTFLYEEPIEFGPVPRPTGCMGRIATLEKDLGTSKQVMGGAILKLVNRVKRLEKQAHLRRCKLVIVDSDEEAEVAAEVVAAKEDDINLDEITALATAALGSEQPAVPTENVEPMEEQEEMEVPLTRKRSTYGRARTQFYTPAFARFRSTISTGVLSPTVVPEPAASYVALDTVGPSVPADKGKALMPDLEIPAEFLAKDAQHSLFQPKPAITEPSAKRQRVEEPSSQPATVFATLVSATVVSAAPDTSSLGASTFSVDSQAKPVSAAPRFTDSTVITTAAIDSAVIRRKVRVSPFAYSAADASPFLSSIAGGPSPSNVFDFSAAPSIFAPRFFVADQIPIGVLFESTSMNLHEFFLDSDEEMPPGVSRVAAEPDSDDEVVAEILFRGQFICGDIVVFVDTLPDDEIADPRFKVETVFESTSSPPLTLRKHLGERGEAFLRRLDCE